MYNKTKPGLDREKGQNKKERKRNSKNGACGCGPDSFSPLSFTCYSNSNLKHISFLSFLSIFSPFGTSPFEPKLLFFQKEMDGKGKQIRMVMGRVVMKKDSADDSSDDEGYEQNQMEFMEDDFFQSNKKKKVVVTAGGGGGGRRVSGGGGGGMRCCQVEKCTADLSDAKQYHRRHKVCGQHAKAQVVLVAGIRQRFCQQCSRFHELSEFDETKRSCRRRLAGHNERRRKNVVESHHVEGSSRKVINETHGTQLKEMACGQADERGRIKITIQENATYKHFQIS